jgi:hypothetical protein
LIDLALGSAQGLGLVAEHTFRGLLDAAPQLVDAFIGRPHRLRRFALNAHFQEPLRHVERVVNPLLVRLANRVVQLTGEERLGLLRLLDRLLHLFQQVGQLPPLPGQFLLQFGALAVVAQRPGSFFISLRELLR